MRIVIAQWLTKAAARTIRNRYMLDNPDKVAYIAKADVDEHHVRSWIVFGDA